MDEASHGYRCTSCQTETGLPPHVVFLVCAANGHRVLNRPSIQRRFASGAASDDMTVFQDNIFRTSKEMLLEMESTGSTASNWE